MHEILFHCVNQLKYLPEKWLNTIIIVLNCNKNVLYDIYFQDKIKILEINLPGKGLVNSIKLCLHWRSIER